MSISSVGAGTGFGRWTFPDDTSNLFRDDGNRTTGVAQPQATQQVAQLPPTLPSAKDLRVYVIDNFGEKDINISRSNTNGDVSHGQVVEGIIRRGLPDAQITRLDTATRFSGTGVPHGRTAAGNLTNTMEHIMSQQTAAQGVPRNRIDLQNFVINMSQSNLEAMTDAERARLTRAAAEFTARGGRVYVAAGNNNRSEIIDVPGITGVDGSDGVIGESPNRQPSDVYLNGDVPNVANSRVAPFHVGDGRIRPFADSPLVWPRGTEAPLPPAPFNGRALNDVLVDQQAIAEPLSRLNAAKGELSRISNQMEGRWPPDPAMQQRQTALSNEVQQLEAQLRRQTAGRVIPASMAPTRNEADTVASNSREVLPRDVDRSKVYVDSSALFDGLGQGSDVFYESAGGVLRPLSSPGLGLASLGTSWATPNFLVEQEVARLQRLNTRPAQP
jgi:hypothetical protein